MPNDHQHKPDPNANTARTQRLDDLLDEGITSVPPIEFTPEWWQLRKAQLLATLPAEQCGEAR